MKCKSVKRVPKKKKVIHRKKVVKRPMRDTGGDTNAAPVLSDGHKVYKRGGRKSLRAFIRENIDLSEKRLAIAAKKAGYYPDKSDEERAVAVEAYRYHVRWEMQSEKTGSKTPGGRLRRKNKTSSTNNAGGKSSAKKKKVAPKKPVGKAKVVKKAKNKKVKKSERPSTATPKKAKPVTKQAPTAAQDDW